MNIAFYAPLKPPTSPTPSGDRLIARLLMRALQTAGHEVDLACRFSSYDRQGDARRQKRLEALGAKLAAKVKRRLSRRAESRRPDLWFTYHLYHRAPDWIGCRVARALGIPYVVAEASYAPKQMDGPWARGHAAVGEMLGHADRVIGLNPDDRACVLPKLASPERYCELKPFIDCGPFVAARANRKDLRQKLSSIYELPFTEPLILTVAMMREGNKLASFRLLADALSRLRDRPWRLLVVGDGPAAGNVKEAFGALAEHVIFAGACEGEQLAQQYAVADLFAWPAVDEPLGMSLLEAQAAGLPVVAGHTDGVASLIVDRHTGFITKPGNAPAFAEAIATLLDNGPLRTEMGNAAAAHAMKHHDIKTGAAGLRAILEGLVR